MINVINNSDYERLPVKSVKQSITNVFSGEVIDEYDVNVIYVNSDYITELNEDYLKHEGDTDVITFTLNEEDEELMGEIYICVQVADRQAKEYKVSLRNELNRLSTHGALHLCGYDDNTDELRKAMSQLEDKYMSVK